MSGLAAIAVAGLWLSLVAALVVLARRKQLGLGNAAAVLVGTTAWLAWLAIVELVLDWPDEPWAAALGVAVTGVALAVAVWRVRPRPETVASAVGLLTAVPLGTGLAVAIAHFTFGDPTADVLAPGEAALALVGGALATVVLRSPTTTALASFSRRERRSVSSVVARLDRLVARDIEVEELVLQSAELLGSWNDDAQVEVWTGGDGLLRRTAAAPYLPAAELRLAEATESVAIRVVDPVGPEWLQVWVPELLPANPDTGTMFAPIVYGNRLRGALVVRGPEAIPEEVVAVLRPVAQRLGAAIHNATLSSALQASLAELRVRERELRASRERLVAAADAERARIERDLHDGAQQQLVALAVNLQLARTLVDTDPERAQRLLAELQQAARAATEELRRISHGIYPPTLRESGLGAALDEATAGSATPVHVHAPAARAPADVEAAVYFACMEAINNATKHAAASRISVTVAVDADRLAFEVVDDGSGFDVDAVGAGSGRGLRNMVDRIGAVDGAMTVDRGHGGTGTRVLGSVPLSG